MNLASCKAKIENAGAESAPPRHFYLFFKKLLTNLSCYDRIIKRC
ncbi:hypothetical protein CLOSTMETH_02007 [[Clostridium] methylpentosum DSM 5476]|uniref:Uncharacterized protein n=1 Tax=[Clostridium] methylpentosum DSM 5476 TaxID=537013 RepID=C0EDS9_9FIRM|nr:hypothetical protein CLOSTMETH_02007 [[Clostridium] methylpentosum DSM 5476]